MYTFHVLFSSPLLFQSFSVKRVVFVFLFIVSSGGFNHSFIWIVFKLTTSLSL